MALPDSGHCEPPSILCLRGKLGQGRARKVGAEWEGAGTHLCDEALGPGRDRGKALPRGRGRMSKQRSWASTVCSTVMASGLAGLCGRGWHVSHSSLGWCRHQHLYLAPRAPAIPTLVHSSSWEMVVTQREA